MAISTSSASFNGKHNTSETNEETEKYLGLSQDQESQLQRRHTNLSNFSRNEASALGEEDDNAETIISRQVTKQDEFDIPDGGYGWVIVGVQFFTSFCCWGGNSGFSIYLAEYLRHNIYHGTGVDYAAVGGLAFGSGFICAPLITYLVGLTNANIVLFVGAACQLAACLLASFATKLWHLYLTQGMLMGFGLALVAAPVPTIVPQWFKKKRSLAMGIGAGGSGAGGILFNLAMQKIVDVKSVRWALRVQTIICVSIIVVCCFLLRTRGDKVKFDFHPWDLQISKSFPFWLVVGWVVFTMFGYVTTQYCLADATVALGFSSKQGSISMALLNVGVLFGRPMAGQVCDKLGVISVVSAIYALCGVFCLTLWLAGRTLGSIYSFAIIIGALMGTIWGTMGSILPRIVGLRKVGVSYGMTWVCIGASGIVSPIIGLSLKKKLPEGVSVEPSQYVWAATFSGVSFLLASLSLFVLRAYIITRDMAAGETVVDSDLGDELEIKVNWKLVVKNLFVLDTPRKV